MPYWWLTECTNLHITSHKLDAEIGPAISASHLVAKKVPQQIKLVIKMKSKISGTVAFGILECAVFLVLLIISIFFAKGVVEEYSAGHTQFSLTKNTSPTKGKERVAFRLAYQIRKINFRVRFKTHNLNGRSAFVRKRIARI